MNAPEMIMLCSFIMTCCIVLAADMKPTLEERVFWLRVSMGVALGGAVLNFCIAHVRWMS